MSVVFSDDGFLLGVVEIDAAMVVEARQCVVNELRWCGANLLLLLLFLHACCCVE